MDRSFSLRTIALAGALLGCTELRPAPTFRPGDGSTMETGAEDRLPPDVSDAPPLDTPEAPPPDAPRDAPPDTPPGGPRLTGTFVASGSTGPRLSGGFVWAGGSSRLSGWLR